MKPLTSLILSAIAVTAINFPAQHPMMPLHPSQPQPHIKFKTTNSPPSPKDAPPSTYDPKLQPQVSLSDTIGPLRSISSFSSFTRLCSSTSSLLSDLSTNTTVLAPLNSAIDKLPRKPWESPADYAHIGPQAYDGTGGHDRANRNLFKFVEAHLVGVSPWPEGQKATTLAGREVWWESRNGERVVMPDEVVVERVASRVSNGEVWILKGVVNYE
ncbi:FAS1 domain-containing protein [Pochonia chlamydosporia 170]|uniref:FAS1 domain-containing protein n=1 Tax=Pochonia chlamydosporia 170 TaxID=1380566 RepID=A0A179FBV1_METCM|nr:FAS1 domain-containing protein [Pochonia chlamydosporia 170]OAQ62780.1 FAS1 domain-containing protein [Pochonia chlamydosporia 170]